MLTGAWCGDLVRCEHVLEHRSEDTVLMLSDSIQSLHSPATTFCLQAGTSSALQKFQPGVRIAEAKSSINKDENMSIF